MDEEIFAATDAAIAKAKGSKDPEVVADYHRSSILIGSPLSGSIIGLAFRASILGVVSVNRSLDSIWRRFAYWHELAHVFRKHIDEPSFGTHQDFGLFTVPVDSYSIPRHEKEANLISAEYSIDTGAVLDLTGYQNKAMKAYREFRKQYKELSREYDNLRFMALGETPTNSVRYRLAECRKALRILEENIHALESDISSMNCVNTISEIADELSANEVIIKYKFEALRIRGYDIDTQELENYNKVFRHVNYID